MTSADEDDDFAKAEELINRVAQRSNKELETESAQIAGRLDSFNGLTFLLLVIITFCTYWCLRKKVVGGFIVTSRRVISVAVTLSATNEQVEYEQANYFIRHFAYEKHAYHQPTYTCVDWCLCQPCINFCLCSPLTPRVRIQFQFLEFPVGDVFQKGNVGSVCFSCCTQFCRSCCDTCLQSFCGSGEWGYKGGTVSVEMKVPYKEGLRRANNVVAAVLFYHPAKNSMFGKEWDPQVDYPDAHPRLLAVPATGDRNFNEWDSSRKVPIERLGSGDVGTWGIVVQEKILDGYAPVTKFCTGTVCFLSCVTLGIGYCWMRCQYDNCTPIVRNFYLLTDRRLIRYTLYTEGAKTVPKLEGDESGKSQFSTEVHSWIMSNITTFRYSEERSCLACCGECCCCAKRDYHVRIWTPFGIISLQDSGKDNLEAFLKSLMNQNFEHPLRGVTNVMPQLGRDRSALCPNEDQDVVFMPAPSGEPSTHAEQPLAKIHGETWGGLFWLLHLVLCRIATCCCFPRSRVADLYVTDTRVITSAVTSVPCLGKVMDTFTEYYALRQVKRIRAAQRYKCQCCGCMNCCSTHVFSLSTDGEFERSLEGEETYVIDKIDGVEGSDLNDQMQLLAATFALMNTTEGWLEKTVLEVGDWNRYIPEGFLLEEDEV